MKQQEVTHINEHGAGHVLAGTSLGEEGVEGIVAAADGLVRRHLAVGLDAVLQAVQLPAGITDLDTGLANVDGDDLTHSECWCGLRRVTKTLTERHESKSCRQR